MFDFVRVLLESMLASDDASLHDAATAAYDEVRRQRLPCSTYGSATMMHTNSTTFHIRYASDHVPYCFVALGTLQPLQCNNAFWWLPHSQTGAFKPSATMRP